MRDMSGYPDRDLAETAGRRPDSEEGRAAAGELLRRHRRAIYLWCFRYVRDHERALDMSQDVMLTVLQRLGSFQGRAAFSSWLFVIVRNRCLNEMRRDHWRDDVELDLVVDERVSFDQSLDDELRAGRLLAVARRELDPVEQRAVWLRYMERMPVDEITVILDLDQRSGARALLQRARRKLRAALGE